MKQGVTGAPPPIAPPGATFTVPCRTVWMSTTFQPATAGASISTTYGCSPPVKIGGETGGEGARTEIRY